MPFEESERVIYQNNPLEIVVCQLRFPPILKIDAELPARFQDRIRNDFPLYQRKSVQPQLPDDFINILPQEIGQSIARSSRPNYEFISVDKQWSVNLTRDFVALTTRSYNIWEEFLARLMRVVEAVAKEYEPVFISRTGLRYKDVIKPNDHEDIGGDWSSLINPYVAGELAAPELQGFIEGVSKDITIKLANDYGKVRIRHGIGKEEGGESLYIIDSDFSTSEEMEVSDAVDRLNLFNRRAGRLFRWFITDRLHEALEPESVGE